MFLPDPGVLGSGTVPAFLLCVQVRTSPSPTANLAPRQGGQGEPCQTTPGRREKDQRSQHRHSGDTARSLGHDQGALLHRSRAKKPNPKPAPTLQHSRPNHAYPELIPLPQGTGGCGMTQLTRAAGPDRASPEPPLTLERKRCSKPGQGTHPCAENGSGRNAPTAPKTAFQRGKRRLPRAKEPLTLFQPGLVPSLFIPAIFPCRDQPLTPAARPACAMFAVNPPQPLLLGSAGLEPPCSPIGSATAPWAPWFGR